MIYLYRSLNAPEATPAEPDVMADSDDLACRIISLQKRIARLDSKPSQGESS
ncbi:hypothetical protein RBSWK_06470 [Rhodopirellula baltica SWK14]|uniref:Uncharacterized protein n=1 Tax=Rhodopirellula baltica SWK14 TaxID=993516 RepID=L7C601_RHOBT|nr:hypothetical protein RBSWK_06470 [Rhodopirellula baltica SWK14]